MRADQHAVVDLMNSESRLTEALLAARHYVDRAARVGGMFELEAATADLEKIDAALAAVTTGDRRPSKAIA